MKQIYLSLYILFATFICYAQKKDIAGYLGHNKYINYEFSYSINYRDFNCFSFHKINYNKILRKNKMITYSIEICKKNIKYESYKGYNDEYKIFDKNIGVKYSWYRGKRGAIAPIGNCWGIGIFMSFEDTWEHYYLREYNDPSYVYKLIEKNHIGVSPLMLISWSRQYVISDKIIFNYGLDFGLSFPKSKICNFRYGFKPNFGLGILI